MNTNTFLAVCSPFFAAALVFALISPEAFKSWGWIAITLIGALSVSGVALAMKDIDSD